MGDKEESHELVRSDLNLEKWQIFTHRGEAKERRLVRATANGVQQVEIGISLRDSKAHTLTAADGKVWYTLLKKWEQAGKPDNEPVRFTIRSLCKELDLPYGNTQSKQLKERLQNLRLVPITFVECYKIAGGEDKHTKFITLLGQLEFFERKRNVDGNIEKYFGFSEFKIDETVMDTILKRGVKPVRLDVIRNLRSDCAFILYRYLDLKLFGRLKHEEDLLDIAEMCDLKKEQRTRKIKQTISDALKELEGKEITTGMIVKAEIIKSKTTRSGWKISVTKGAQVPVLEQAIDYGVVFQSLPVEEQETIRKQAEDESKGTLFFNNLSEEGKRDWIAGTIESILKERIAQGKGIVPPLEAEKGHGTEAIRATKKSVKDTLASAASRRKAARENEGGAGGTPAAPSPIPEMSGAVPEGTDAGAPSGDRQAAPGPELLICKVTYQNPGAQEVKVAGEWGKWDPEVMQPAGAGVWQAQLQLSPGDYKYKLIVDGVWQSNPDGEMAGDPDGNNTLRVQDSPAKS